MYKSAIISEANTNSLFHLDALNYNQPPPKHPHINAEPTSATLTLQKLCTQNKGELSLSLSLSLWLEPIQSLAPDPGSGECSSCHIRQLVYELQKGQCLERKSRRHGSLFGHSTADKPALFLSLSWACILTIIHYLAPTWSTFHLLLLSALQGFLLKR